MALSTVDRTSIILTAQETLAELNKEFQRNVRMQAVTLGDLEKWGLNPRFAGFVIQERPDTLYIVPENIRVASEAVKTVRHEFRHVLDLTGACPFCTGQTRELRALTAETQAIAARMSNRSIQLNKALEMMVRNPPPDEVEGRAVALNLALETILPRGVDRYKMKLQAVIGEFVAAQTHLAHLDPDIAARIRALKRRLQIAIWGRSA